MTLAFEEQVGAILKRHREDREKAIGSLMLAQLAFRAGDLNDGMIHLNDALKLLSAQPDK